jgi:hypothetical protein
MTASNTNFTANNHGGQQMLSSDWVPRLLTDQQPDDLRFGGDAPQGFDAVQQNPISGLLGPTPQPQQDEPTTLLC